MFTFTGNTSTSDAVITGVASTAGIQVGGYLEGTGIAVGATVVSFVANTSVTMSAVATSGTGSLTVTYRVPNPFTAAPQFAVAAVVALTVSVTALFTSAPAFAVDASMALTGATSSFRADPAFTVNASMALTGATSSFRADPAFTVGASMALTGSGREFRAAPAFGAVGSMTLSGATAAIHAAPSFGVNASMTLTGASDKHGMSICDVRDDILSMWGILTPCAAPDFAKEAAINIINSSLQLVWNNARDRSYWSSSTLTLTFAADAASQDLPDDIQNVVGPCRRSDNRRPLAPIGTIGELETFSDIYLDGETADEPLAYHVERLNQAGNDPAKTVLHVTPTPAEETAFLLEVVLEAPRFNLGDFTSCPIIPIPHSYVESLLLPVVRYQATAFYLFRKADQKETIDREYQQARISLGLADPLPGKSGDNKEGTPAK